MRILHLEDDRRDAELVEATLAADGLVCEIVRVETREGFIAALEAGGVDLILADDSLPSFDGLSAFAIAREQVPATPFIFLSGTIGEEAAIERLKSGATDSVIKQRMGRLPFSIRRALREAAERRQAEEEVRRLNASLERRVAERTAELAESERRLEAILDHAPASICLKDAEGRYLLINRAFEHVFGVTRDAIAGRTDDDVFPARLAGTYRDNDRQVLKDRRGQEIDEPVLQADGARVYRSIRFPLIDAAGRPYAVCSIATDITRRKMADDELKMARLEAERASLAKSQFLSRMSHDLRTPLNAILGFAQLLELEKLGDAGRESVSQILRGGQHLLGLINEVLDIARIEAGHLSLSAEPVDAVEVVQQAVELIRPLATERGIEVVMTTPPRKDIVISADRQRLNQILLNLLSNAVKYNRPNGRVTVAFEAIAGTRMRITIADTGAGIPAAKMALLFQPFERLGAEYTRVEGTGLGLAVSRGLAEAMDGKLGVESEMDRGSTFWIELGLSDEPQPRRAEPAFASDPEPALPTAAGLVLYIEDNSSNVRLMQRVLERRPAVRLQHAPSGEDGLRLAREQRPNLVFLDLHLPDMSGEDVLRRIWEDPSLREIPVAVLSADATSGHVRRLLASGAVAYLTKPLEIRQVIGLIDERLPGAPRTPTDERGSHE